MHGQRADAERSSNGATAKSESSMDAPRRADVTAGSDFVQEAKGSPGSYVVVADPVAYKADALTLIHGVSKQFAQALRKGQ